MWNGAVLAESDRTVLVEGNQYFPPEDIAMEFFEAGPTATHCFWKGDASYFHVVVGESRNNDAAWYYSDPYEAALAIKGYVAFWKGIEVSGVNVATPEIVPPRK
jgi:uncharacterized protein (DUF427 family)